jgi:hypothetical protein
MSGLGSQGGFGARRGKREVIDVIEPKAQDRTLDKLLNVRKQRIERFERERREAREAWRRSRQQLRDAKEAWRTAVQDAKDFWQAAREEFFRMSTTSGEFRKAKATYERMKGEAMELRLACNEFVSRAKAAGREFFASRLRLLQANKQQEKLSILRDEIRLMTKQSEM